MAQPSLSDSVTAWFHQLREGNVDAPERLWNRYFDRLVSLARVRMQNQPRRVSDEEDIAISVFETLRLGAENGNFSKISDRDDLWALLITITKRKVVNRVRWETAQKRGGGDVRGESVFWKGDGQSSLWGLDQIAGDTPTPQFLESLCQAHEHLLSTLQDDVLRTIAVRRLEGYSNDEIADELGVTTRTVRRKLNIIRECWAKEI